ncbi:MAG: hypothetical protein IPO60_02345 [Flavobacteriales bacterium]|nr:hypothetical protein [Flavobacteriales bacterium]
MDLKTLKLELLERIALLEDEARLMALKRLLDSPRGYGIPNEHLSVVKEGEEPYIKLEDRSYSADEVRRLMESLIDQIEIDQSDPEGQLSEEEWDALEKDRDAYLRGEGKFTTWEEIKDRWRKEKL